MKINLRQDEIKSLCRLCDFYIENFRGAYNEKRAALMLRHKLKRYDNKRNNPKQKQLLQDSDHRRACEPWKDTSAQAL